MLELGSWAALISRTAGYGPVCPVVWEGSPREGATYPDELFFVRYISNCPAPLGLFAILPVFRQVSVLAFPWVAPFW